MNARFYIWQQYGGTHATNLGALPEFLKKDGWIKHVENSREYFAWAGPHGGIALHNAFGIWSEIMELDSYDWATNSGADWITHGFAAAWREVCAERPVLAYVGNVGGHTRLTSLTPADLAKMIRRNIKPYKDAGMAGIVFDAACDAITYPHTLPRAYPHGGLRSASRDAVALAVIDNSGYFPQRTAIEPLPRRFAPWGDLATRDTWIEERTFRHNHSSDAAADLGFGMDLSHIKGRIHRILYPADEWSNSPEKMIQCAREIVKAGHVPCIPAWFVWKQYKPEDFLEAA